MVSIDAFRTEKFTVQPYGARRFLVKIGDGSRKNFPTLIIVKTAI